VGCSRKVQIGGRRAREDEPGHLQRVGGMALSIASYSADSDMRRILYMLTVTTRTELRQGVSKSCSLHAAASESTTASCQDSTRGIRDSSPTGLCAGSCRQTNALSGPDPASPVCRGVWREGAARARDRRRSRSRVRLAR
jgi:hypothetical protein